MDKTIVFIKKFYESQKQKNYKPFEKGTSFYFEVGNTSHILFDQASKQRKPNNKNKKETEYQKTYSNSRHTSQERLQSVN